MVALNPIRGFNPNWSTHPGEHLEEYLELNGWSQAEFARRAGLTPKLVSDILNGKNPVTPDTAMKLERVLGLKAEIWLSLQSSWDLFQAREKERAPAPETKSWLSKFPIKELKARKVLPDASDDGVLLNALLKLFGIGAPSAYQAKLGSLAVQHRQSNARTSVPDHVFAWLMLGELEARKHDLPIFDLPKFAEAVKEIRGLTREEPRVFEPRMKKLCREAGVALALVKPLGEIRLYGSARWIDGNQRAIIQMSLRMKTNDHFWWTFFHECGHIILHRGMTFADDPVASEDNHEREADDWAHTVLYGQNRLSGILARQPRSEVAVRHLADELDLHPGILVGMLQHHGILRHGHLHRLKTTFQWKDEAGV